MNLLLNLLIAFLFGFLVDYVARRCGADSTIAIILGVIAGIIVFLASPAALLHL